MSIAWVALAACDAPNVDLSKQSYDGAVGDLVTSGDPPPDGGDGDGGAAGPLPAGATPEVGPYADFVAARARAFCQWLVRCGTVGATDEADCESAESAEVQSAPPPYSVDDGIAAGRATLDATATKACTDALGAAACSARDVDAVHAACSHVVKGAVATGLGCRADFECADGWCANVALGCGAICRPFAGAGFACASAVCDAASFCDPLTQKCVADGAMTQSCDDKHPCAAPLVCRGFVPSASGSTPGECGPVAKAGESCATSDECALGLYCASATRECTARIATAQQCSDLDACVGGDSCRGLTYPKGTSVGKPGTCAAFLDVGAACDPTVDDSGCPRDSACGKTSKTCDPVGAAGSACPPRGCRDGLYCDSRGLCQPLVAYGAACAPSDARANLSCRFGACDATAHACLTYCP